MHRLRPYLRCTAASAEQPSQGRLPAGRSNRCQTTSQVAPLASVKHRVTYNMAAQQTFKTMSSSTPAYLNDLIQRAVPRSPRSSDARLLNVQRTRTEFARRSFSVTAAHNWNSYHPTLDQRFYPAVLWTPSNDTSRPICSDSLNLMPPAPRHLRTLWRYECC